MYFMLLATTPFIYYDYNSCLFCPHCCNISQQVTPTPSMGRVQGALIYAMIVSRLALTCDTATGSITIMPSASNHTLSSAVAATSQASIMILFTVTDAHHPVQTVNVAAIEPTITIACPCYTVTIIASEVTSIIFTSTNYHTCSLSPSPITTRTVTTNNFQCTATVTAQCDSQYTSGRSMKPQTTSTAAAGVVGGLIGGSIFGSVLTVVITAMAAILIAKCKHKRRHHHQSRYVRAYIHTYIHTMIVHAAQPLRVQNINNVEL